MIQKHQMLLLPWDAITEFYFQLSFGLQTLYIKGSRPSSYPTHSCCTVNGKQALEEAWQGGFLSNT